MRGPRSMAVPVLLWALVVTIPVATAEEGTLFDEAVALFRDGDYREASEMFRQIIHTSPEYFWGWHYFGACHWKLGDLEEAADALRIATGLKPESFEAHYTLGRVLFESGDHDEAIAHLEQALLLASTPDHHRAALQYLATACSRAGRYDGARDSIEEHIASHGSDSISLQLLATTCHHLGDLACALDSLRSARELDPDQVRVQRRIATLSQYRVTLAGDEVERDALFMEAVQDAEAWITARPADIEARVNLIEFLLTSEDYTRAAEAARAAFTSDEIDCDVATSAARAFRYGNDFENALLCAERAVRCREDDPEALQEAARAHVGRVRYLLDNGSAVAHGAEIEGSIDRLEWVFPRLEQAGPDPQAASLRGEADALAVAYRQRRDIEMDDTRRIARQNRCEVLRVRLWQVRMAENGAADAEPLTNEEKGFLHDECDVERP